MIKKCSGRGKLRLWTLQPIAAARTLEGGNAYFSKPDFEKDWGEGPSSYWSFRQAYAWMAERMAERIGPPPTGVEHPVWAWARPPFTTMSGAPDLRRMREDQPRALIELLVEPCETLISDHSSWHHVLNGRPLGLSEAESDLMDLSLSAIAQRSDGIPRVGAQILPSDYTNPDVLAELGRGWLRIFEVGPILPGIPVKMAYIDPCDRDWVGDGDIAAQSCLWRIEPGQMVSWRPVAPTLSRKIQ
ncbi:DUF3841 domain-containing protein [Propionivibrio sp.]|uniref:DUF3841 domain-containing protein n=1 Tax=Propionivibrio sp. TaxID=2212460 RepID=UPI003BEF8000